MKLFRYLSNFILPFLIAIFNLFILLFPNEILNASKDGIVLWATNVLPTLLPFVIGTNILIGTGIVELMGIFLEPLMFPLFKVAGCSAFALICGMISGYPVGAKITQSLRSCEQISKSQAQRLISFCNNSGPLFILGAIGTSMLGNKNYGYFIMIAHYLSAIIVGIMFRFFYGSEKDYVLPSKRIFFRAFNHVKFVRTDKNIGKLFAQSVHDSIETVLQIGGFIVVFSIVSKILELSNVIVLIWNWLAKFDFIRQIGYETFSGIIVGIIEITNGAKILTAQNFSPSILIILSALVSFGGFSVHMQSISFISKTDIKANLYILAKIIHAFISAVIAAIMLPFFNFQTQSVAASNYDYSFISKMIFSLENLLFIIVLQVGLIFLICILKYFCKKH